MTGEDRLFPPGKPLPPPIQDTLPARLDETAREALLDEWQAAFVRRINRPRLFDLDGRPLSGRKFGLYLVAADTGQGYAGSTRGTLEARLRALPREGRRVSAVLRAGHEFSARLVYEGRGGRRRKLDLEELLRQVFPFTWALNTNRAAAACGATGQVVCPNPDSCPGCKANNRRRVRFDKKAGLI